MPVPALEPLPTSADVVVIGGGVVGVACALELARRGAGVVVIERGRVGHGCSYGNAGWLTPSQALPLANPNLLLKSFGWLLDPEHHKPDVRMPSYESLPADERDALVAYLIGLT